MVTLACLTIKRYLKKEGRKEGRKERTNEGSVVGLRYCLGQLKLNK